MPPKVKVEVKVEKAAPTRVNPYTIDVTQALTAVVLLDSAEDPVIFLSICTLDTYVTTYGQTGLSYLQEHDLLAKTFKNLGRCQQIRTISLKLIVKLLELDKILTIIQSTTDYIDVLIHIFMTTDNMVEVEFSSFLLSRACVAENCAEILCKEEIIAKLFDTIVRNMDPDIKNNCLYMLLNMVNCLDMRTKISESPSFRIGILNLVLRGPFMMLRFVTVKIFDVITDWSYGTFQTQFLETKTLSFLLDVLFEPTWTNIQNEALHSIFNCLKYNPVQVEFIETKDFQKFCVFARDAGPEHALACLALINELIVEESNLQVVLAFNIHSHVHEYCKYEDDLVTVKFCDTLVLFCKNCQVIPELASMKILPEIEKLMRKAELPWNPYRQSAIHPLFLFLMNNPRLGILYYRINVINHILDAIKYREDIDSLCYKMVLEMFQTMLCSKCLHEYLWNKEIYTQFVNLLQDRDPEFVKISIDIIQRTFYSRQYREWFVELGGVEALIKMIVKRDCDYINSAVSFCKIASKYRELCIAFLRAGVIPVIQDLGQTSIRQKHICASIVDDIYKCELSIKFHDTWFLDYHDITSNGFCVYVGYKPRIFPPAEVNKKFSFSSTIITVNFHGKKHEKIPVAIGYQPQHHLSRDNSGPSKSSGSDEVSSSYTSVESAPIEKVIYKLSLPLPEGKPVTDFYLKTYLKKAKILLDNPCNHSSSAKIIALAKFVVNCFSGHEGHLPMRHQYDTHITELKKKYCSNYIPLGSLRIGSMVERAMLFKVLSDRLGIPSTLRRTSDYCAWNEVTIYSNNSTCLSSNLRYNFLQECVVDLIEDVGALLLKGQHNTNLYCQKSELYAHSFETDNITDSVDSMLH